MRSFETDTMETDYFYRKAAYWLYQRSDRKRAAHFSDRLRWITEERNDFQGSIMEQFYLAVISDIDGDWRSAVKHWKKSIAIMYLMVDEIPNCPKDLHPRFRRGLRESAREASERLIVIFGEAGDKTSIRQARLDWRDLRAAISSTIEKR